MRFIELTGKRLASIVDDKELTADDLKLAEVDDDTIVRINEQGDIEVRRHHRWSVIGGLLGDFAHRIPQATGLDWV
jgi:hypothetical protein